MATQKAIDNGKVFNTTAELIGYAVKALTSRASRQMRTRARIDKNETSMSAFETDDNKFDAPAIVQTDSLSLVREELHRLLGTLESRKRSIMLHYLNGSSDVETAKAHSISAAQVRQIRHRIITRLRG